VNDAYEVLDCNPKGTDHSRIRRKWQYNMAINLSGRLVGLWAEYVWL